MNPHRLVTLAAICATALVLAISLPAAAQVGTSQGLLNPNLADKAELAALPHMDAAKAQRVVDGRPWASMIAVNNAIGVALSDEQRDELYSRLWLPLNLNEAGSVEIGLIPGVGERMTHEFEEYRPYVALAQFRREIGKYVDDDEVARLEQYVFVPLDLNTASSEDFATIPGVGPRMIREFEEYRPYAALSQFERKVGKYVDAGEIKRLARYMTIRKD
jgi:DNA uptake protein ComE-like DNA-binding protein